MRHTWTALLAGTLALVPVATAGAGDLTYQPRNPSFGGKPFYSSHLLGTARAQDDFEAPGSGDIGLDQDPASRFKRQLQSQLLGELANQVSTSIFPEEKGQEPRDKGSFQYDDILVDFNRTSGAVKIDITDTQSGEVTNIQVPVFDGNNGN